MSESGSACIDQVPEGFPREAAIRSLFAPTGLGLEIGPSYNPIVPKREGYRVEVVDHLDTVALRAKYANEANVDATKIEEVDHVWHGEPLSELVGRERFDYIVASHVIEHTPDMLGFLEECAAMLKPDGELVLVVPDRRKCFDFFRPVSSTGDVLQARLERRSRHAPGSAFDQIANCATLDGAAGWMSASRGQLGFLHTVDQAAQLFDLVATSSDYIDCHAWVFTPSSFRLILKDLADIGRLPLRERGLWRSDVFEFVSVLSRSARGCPLDRPALLRAIHEELTTWPFTA